MVVWWSGASKWITKGRQKGDKERLRTGLDDKLESYKQTNRRSKDTTGRHKQVENGGSLWGG